MCRTFLFVYKDNLWRILFTLWKTHQKKSDFYDLSQRYYLKRYSPKEVDFSYHKITIILATTILYIFFKKCQFFEKIFNNHLNTSFKLYFYLSSSLFFTSFLYIFLYLFILSIFWIDFRVGIIIVRVSNIKKHLENEKNRSIRSFERAFICMFKEWR